MVPAHLVERGDIPSTQPPLLHSLHPEARFVTLPQAPSMGGPGRSGCRSSCAQLGSHEEGAALAPSRDTRRVLSRPRRSITTKKEGSVGRPVGLPGWQRVLLCVGRLRRPALPGAEGSDAARRRRRASPAGRLSLRRTGGASPSPLLAKQALGPAMPGPRFVFSLYRIRSLKSKELEPASPFTISGSMPVTGSSLRHLREGGMSE
ncbi:small integral membrane protein 35 [Paroedura picta]|uniref:small integral membrane protein 35 n=1 Tax=Paroedura picta TaxID=143630 RepID=UPI004057345D